MTSRRPEPRARCCSCNGTGFRILTPAESNALCSVDNTWTATAAVHHNIGGDRRVSHTALVNRLNRLVVLGLLERRKVSHASGGLEVEWRWSPDARVDWERPRRAPRST